MVFREGWADYFESHHIQYAFFSAANGIALQEERARQEELAALDDISEGSEEEEEEEDDFAISGMKVPKSGNKLKAALKEDKKSSDFVAPSGITRPTVKSMDDESDTEDEDDEDDEVDDLTKKMRRGAGISVPGSDEADRTRILSVLELEELFLSHAPEGRSPLALFSSSRQSLTRDLSVDSHPLTYGREDGRRTRRIPERRKIVNNQRPDRREEGLGLFNSRSHEASPNPPALSRSPPLRLSRIGLPSIRSYESRFGRRWCPAHRSTERVHSSRRVGHEEDPSRGA